MLNVGIDPGKTGGIACLNPDGTVFKAYGFNDWKSIALDLREWKEMDNLLVALEKVHAFSGQGVSSIFTFGSNFGGWSALLEAFSIPYVLVPPQTWQKNILGTFPKGESKDRAYSYVTKRYPALNLKKKDSGMIDAICMALYIRDNN